MQRAEPWTTRRITNLDIGDDPARLQGRKLRLVVNKARDGEFL
jgi:hypothetical protein